MARPKSKADHNEAAVGDEQTPGLPAMKEAADLMAKVETAYTEERDLANQLFGQAQMANAFAKFSTVVTLSKLKYIKESKLYRAFKGKTIVSTDGTESRLVGTWEEYCGLLGLSVSKVDEDLTNLGIFGEDALENLNRIGAGYRELRKLRKLPDEVRATVAGQLVNLDDKEEVVALIDELATRHATEKTALEKQVAELQEDAKATDKVIAAKNQKLDAQEKLLAKLQNKSGDWVPRAKEICIENTRIAADILEGFDKLDQLRDAILNEDFGEDDREAAIEAMAVVYFDAANQIIGRAAEVMAACEEVFVGYKDKAMPMLDVFAVQGE